MTPNHQLLSCTLLRLGRDKDDDMTKLLQRLAGSKQLDGSSLIKDEFTDSQLRAVSELFLLIFTEKAVPV